MSRLDNNPDLAVGMSAATARMNTAETEHWKYPETVGNDTIMDDINFNSHESSEFAIARMNHISAMTHEPFMMFEFMKVDNDDYGMDKADNLFNRKIEETAASWKGIVVTKTNAVAKETEKTLDEGGSIKDKVINQVRDWAASIGTLVKRKYIGSICLYMPTDIAINDTMVYNDDSRKMGAFAQTIFSDNYADAFNATTLTSDTALALGGAVAGKVFGAGALGALGGAGLAQVVGTEIQRASGKIANPNEILLYNSTTLRTFSFAWTILPDSEDESKEAAGLIKMFRRSAHATKNNLMIVTVPDHVVVSFHGAGSKGVEMIQLPPCVIESVAVTYNPNNSSFFKQNNAPVEIGLAITLKEMVPIYSDDVEAGY